MNKIVDLEYPDIPLKQYPKKSNNLFSFNTCLIAVNYWVYDKRKRIVVHSGSSRPCGCNHHKASIHAEQIALEYLRKHKKNKGLQVYIWKWSKSGELKPAYCCISCKQLLLKYKYENNFFTFINDEAVNAIIENPKLSLAYRIKYDLTH